METRRAQEAGNDAVVDPSFTELQRPKADDVGKSLFDVLGAKLGAGKEERVEEAKSRTQLHDKMKICLGDLGALEVVRGDGAEEGLIGKEDGEISLACGKAG